jgi:Uma2 family endonuclease
MATRAPRSDFDAVRVALLAAIRDLPPELTGEILGGALRVSPRPAGPHARTSSVVGADVLPPFQRGKGGPGGWWILDEPELHLGADVLVPDVAGWRRERLPDVGSHTHFSTVPDWVCEVLSPATATDDRVRKLPIYASHGVSWLWLVDPVAESVEVMRLRSGLWSIVGVHAHDVVVRLEPFEAVEFELAAWWGR